MTTFLRSFLLLALVALLFACASSSPPPVLLTLPPSVSIAPDAATSEPAAAPRLIVRRVGIPEYLVSRRVRYRADPSTLAEWPNTYWAERIEIGVSREFISALRQALPGWALCEAACDEAASALTLQVEIVPMDYLRGSGRLQAGARFVVMRAGANPQEVQRGAASFSIAVSSDTAQGQAEALTALIRQVAAKAAPLVLGARR